MGNMENFGQNPQQQQNYQQPNYGQPPQQQGYYAPPQGPSVGALFHQSPLAKLGLVITILAIIGLILSYAVPWVYIDADGLDDKFFGHDFENSDDLELLNNDVAPYYHGTPGMADLGFIFLMILGIVAIIWGLIGANYQNRYSWFSLVGLILAATAILPSIMILIAGVRFIGVHITSALNESSFMGMGDNFVAYPAGYVILIFGFIMFLLVLKMLKGQNMSLSAGMPNKMYFFKGGENK